MSIQENKAMVRRICDEVWNGGQLDVVDELFSPTYIGRMPGMPSGGVKGPEGFKNLVSSFRSAFSDLNLTLEDIFAEGDKIVFRWTSRGTNDGTFNNMPPTGRKIEIMGVTIFRISNHLVQEEWEGFDSMALMQQLGVIPAPG